MSLDQLHATMSEGESDYRGYTDGESGTPWGSPGGAIKRWIRHYRRNGTDDSSSDADE
jgi:hypothetical protein